MSFSSRGRGPSLRMASCSRRFKKIYLEVTENLTLLTPTSQKLFVHYDLDRETWMVNELSQQSRDIL